MAMAVAVAATLFAAQNDPLISVEVEKGASYDVVCKGESLFTFTPSKTGKVNVQGVGAKSMNVADYQINLLAAAPASFEAPGPDCYGDGGYALEGEFYALVWMKKDADFKGFVVDERGVVCKDEDNNSFTRVYGTADSSGKCVPGGDVTLEPPSGYEGGHFAVYLLDTRKPGTNDLSNQKDGLPTFVKAYKEVTNGAAVTKDDWIPVKVSAIGAKFPFDPSLVLEEGLAAVEQTPGIWKVMETPKAIVEIVDNGIINTNEGAVVLCDPGKVNPEVELSNPFALDVTYKFTAFDEDVRKVVDAISPDMPKDKFGCADFKDIDAVTQAATAALQAGKITEAQLQAASDFLASAAPFWSRNCDFVISFDKPVKAGSFVLGGWYEQAGKFGFDGWVYSSHDKDLDVGERMRLLRDNSYTGAYVTYYEICSRVQDFLCGVKNLSAENVGTTMTVELRIYDGSETLEKSCLVASYTHTLEGAAAVDDTAYMTLEEAAAAWKDGTTLKLLKDGQANLVVPSGENRTLDLNGCVLSGLEPVTVSTGAGLTVKDSDPTKEHAFSVGANGLWALNDNGTEKLAGGCITGGQREVGGGISNSGALVLEGGNVVGNLARSAGGGIANTESTTSFTMTGGSIVGNVVTGQLLEEYDISEIAPGITPSVVTNSCGGGGVFNAGVFKMTSGAIRDNQAMAATGGGVCNCSTGRFDLSGGKTLEDAKLALIDNCQAYNGGGIANYAVLNITGGRISNCVATNLGGGVYTRTFGMENGMEMSDGIIYNCSAHGEAGDGVASEGGTVEITGASEINLSFDGFNSGVGVFANGGTLAVRGGKILMDTSVGAGELAHTTTAIRIVHVTTIIEHGEIKAEYGDAIWAEMYDSKFTLTGDAEVHGNLKLRVVSSDKIEISGGKLTNGSVESTDADGNKTKGVITELDAEGVDEELYAEKKPVTDDSVAAVVSADGTETNGYDTIEAALKAVTSGTRLVLLKNESYGFNLDMRTAATFELNGKNLTGRLRDSYPLNLESGPNGGGEDVTLDEFTANSYGSASDVRWGTDGKKMTIVADRVSVPSGRLVLADSTEVTITGTPSGYAGIAEFVLRQTLAENGSVTNSAKLTLRGGRYGSDMAQLENPLTGVLEAVSLTNYVADGYVLHDNLNKTFSVIPRPVVVETPDLDNDKDVIQIETEEGTDPADEKVVKAAATDAVGEIAGNAAVANFKDTNAETAIRDDKTGATTDATLNLLKAAAEQQVSSEFVESAKEEIDSSKEVTSYINVKLTNVNIRTFTVASETAKKTICDAVVYDVKPIVTTKVKVGDDEQEVTAVISNDQLKDMGAKLTFRLAVPDSFANTAQVYHEDALYGVFPILTERMSDGKPYRFVEVTSDSFSSWKVATSDFVACIGTTGYKTLSAAFAAVNPNETIEVLCDIAAADVATNKVAATLDLRGNAVTGTDALVYSEGALTIVGPGSLRVDGEGELYAIRAVGASASVTVRATDDGKSGTDDTAHIDGIFTDGENVTLDLAGAKLDRACKCVANGESVRKITNGRFKQSSGAAEGSKTYVAETHYLNGTATDDYREVLKNKVRATWTNGEGNAMSKYYATFADAIDACYSCRDLKITLCDNIYESKLMPANREGTFEIETSGYTINTENLTPADGYTFVKTDTGYAYKLRDPVAEVISSDGSTIQYASVKRAFAAATEGSTIRLLADSTTDSIDVSNGMSVTLDLNGKTLKGVIVNGSQEIVNVRAVIVNDGNLTIIDSSGNDVGCIYNTSTGNAGTDNINPSVYNNTNGTLTVAGGTIGSNDYNIGSAIFNESHAKAYIKGGKFTNHNSGGAPVFRNNSDATMEITGGTIIGTVTGWVYNFGTLSVGGTFSTVGSRVRTYGIASNAGATTTVTGGQFDLVYANITADGVPCEFVVATDGATAVNVSGGTFTGAASYPEGAEWRLYHMDFGKPVLTGGTYPTNVNDSVAAFYYSHDNQDGTWTVRPWKGEYDAITNVFPADSVSVTIDKNGKITAKLLQDIGSLALTDALPTFDLDLNLHSIAVNGGEGEQSAIIVTHDESVDREASNTITLVGPGYVKSGDGDGEVQAIRIEEGAKLIVDSTGAGVIVLNGIPEYTFEAMEFAITDIFIVGDEVFITIRPDFASAESTLPAEIAAWGFKGANPPSEYASAGIKALAYTTPDCGSDDEAVKSVRFVSATADEVTVAVPKTANATAEFYKVRLTSYP